MKATRHATGNPTVRNGHRWTASGVAYSRTVDAAKWAKLPNRRIAGTWAWLRRKPLAQAVAPTIRLRPPPMTRRSNSGLTNGRPSAIPRTVGAVG